MFFKKSKKDDAPEIAPPTTTVPPTDGPTPEDVEAVDDSQEAKGLSLSQTETHHEYPTGLKLALVLSSAFLSMFLISLVCEAIPHRTLTHQKIIRNVFFLTSDLHRNRIVSLYLQLFLELPMTSTLKTILVGTVQHTCSPPVPFNCHSVKSTHSSASNTPSCQPLSSSKLVQLSAVQLPIPPLSLLAERLPAWVVPGS